MQGQLEIFTDVSNQQQNVHRQNHMAHRESTDEYAKAMADARLQQMLTRAADYKAHQERKLQARTEAALARVDAYKKKKTTGTSF